MSVLTNNMHHNRVSFKSPDRHAENDGVPKQRKARPGFARNLNSYITEYTENTSIHGVRYLAEKKKSRFERIWWILFFLASLYFCIHLIVKTYIKWTNSPVIVTFAQAPTPVWDIPFPAITICPQTKSSQSAFNFTHYYHLAKEDNNNMTKEEWKKFRDAALLCNYQMPTSGNATVDYKIVKFIQSIAPKEPLLMCRWLNKNLTCEDLFVPVLTEEGICYTFNMLDRDEVFTNEAHHHGKFMQNNKDSHGWNIEDGYPANATLDTYPKRTTSSGQAAGLTIVMKGNEHDLDYICNGPIQGYKIILHHPAEVPRVSSQFFLLPLNEEMLVNIKPQMISTSKNLRRYTPQQRLCYFTDERELAYYKTYTQQNCEMECLTNYTRQACNCVAYYMPHDEATPICGYGNIRCMKEVRDGMVEREVSQGLERNASSIVNNGVECNCLPACTSLTFNSEFSQTNFDWVALFQSFMVDTSEMQGFHYTRLMIFFKEQQFITSTRNELYGVTDFLANCGGLLGLFIGFSFLSLVETLYFLTLRLWCNIRRHGKELWSGAPDLMKKSDN